MRVLHAAGNWKPEALMTGARPGLIIRYNTEVSLDIVGIAVMPWQSAHVATAPPSPVAKAVQKLLAPPQAQLAGHVNASADRGLQAAAATMVQKTLLRRLPGCGTAAAADAASGCSARARRRQRRASPGSGPRCHRR